MQSINEAQIWFSRLDGRSIALLLGVTLGLVGGVLALLLVAQKPIRVDDGGPIATSFPVFEPLMAGLGAAIRRANT